MDTPSFSLLKLPNHFLWTAILLHFLLYDTCDWNSPDPDESHATHHVDVLRVTWVSSAQLGNQLRQQPVSPPISLSPF